MTADLLTRLLNPELPGCGGMRKEAHERIVRLERREARLTEALRDAVKRCDFCGGGGLAYSMEDETQIGQAPGSSGFECPVCSMQRAALKPEGGPEMTDQTDRLERLYAVAAMDLRTGGFLAHTMDTAKEAATEITRLERELAEARAVTNHLHNVVGGHDLAMADATARAERLAEALEPFAKAAASAEPDEDGRYSLYSSSARHQLTLGDLRRARDELSALASPVDCSTCDGAGVIDQRMGGEATSSIVPCPDCLPKPDSSEPARDAAIRALRSSPPGAKPVSERTFGLELKPFKPCVFVNDTLGLTEAIFEDVSHTAKPLFEKVYHWIDTLHAHDDDRLVGIQIWATKPAADPAKGE